MLSTGPACTVVVTALSDQEAAAIGDTLIAAGLDARPCTDVGELVRLISKGAAIAVITEDVVGCGRSAIHGLDERVMWSDFPVGVPSNGPDGSPHPMAPGLPPNGIVLKPHTDPRTLVTMVRTLLWARERQCQFDACLGAERARTRDVVETIYDGYLLMDADWRCLYVNRYGADLLGLRHEDLVGANMRETMPHWEGGGFRSAIEHVLTTGLPLSTEEYCPLNGRWFDIRCKRSATGAAFFFRDITASKNYDTERRAYERSLTEARDTLALALHSAAMGLWDFNLVTDELVWSDQSKVIFGLPTDAVITRERFAEFIHPEDREMVKALVGRSLDPDQREPYVAQFRIVWDDGSPHWISSRGRVYFEGGRAVRFIGTVVDATREKLAEQHLRLLVDELNHRVKNMLAVIHVISAQTFKDGLSADRVSAFEGRLRGLAETYALLTTEGWENVDLGLLVNRVVRHVDEHRVRTEGPSVRLSAKASLAIGMTLHELATNAAKYGALAVADGVVDVRWQCHPGHLRLAWVEHGVPHLKPPSTAGFGTRLIEQTICYELDGEVTRKYEADGLECVITIPDSTVVARYRACCEIENRPR